MITLDAISDDALNTLYALLVVATVVAPPLFIGFRSAQSMHKEQQKGWK